jgi:predicted MFS family arabinose efflux permease
MAYIGDIIAYEDRQTVLARFLSGQILGLIFGQTFGGIFSEFLSWRGIFILLGGLYLLITLLLFVELRSPRVVKAETVGRFSLAGQLKQIFGLLVIAKVRSVLIAVFLEGFLFFGAMAYVSAFLKHTFALNYFIIGIVLSCFGLGGLFYALMVVIGGGVLASCFAGITLIPTWGAIAPLIILIGLGFYMFHNTLQTNATQMAPHARGSAVSLFALCFFLGQAVGVAVSGMIVDGFGFQPVFIANGLLLLGLSVWFRWTLIRDHKPAGVAAA